MKKKNIPLVTIFAVILLMFSVNLCYAITIADNCPNDGVWASSCGMYGCYISIDGEGQTISSVYYCIDTSDTCTPSHPNILISPYFLGFPPPCASQNRYIRVQAWDGGGNPSNIMSWHQMIDRTDPVMTQSYTATSGVWATSVPQTVTVGASDAHSGVAAVKWTTYCGDYPPDADWTTVSGPPYDITFNSDINQVVDFLVWDNVGRHANSYSYPPCGWIHVKIDTTPPTPNPAQMSSVIPLASNGMTLNAVPGTDAMSGGVKYRFWSTLGLYDVWHSNPTYTYSNMGGCNMQYWFRVQYKDNAGNEGQWSSKLYKYSLPCNPSWEPSPGWYFNSPSHTIGVQSNDGNVIVNDGEAGKRWIDTFHNADYVRYVWDKNTGTDASSGTQWDGSSKTFVATSSGNWYLHVIAYNPDGNTNSEGTKHFGPFDIVLTKPDGSPCSSGSECTSTYCVDGVCCNNACGGTCKRCDSYDGTAGTCHNIHDNHDPDGECSTSWNACDSTCIKRGPDGYCDGSGSCDTNDATQNIANGDVCSGGSEVNPSGSNYCDRTIDCNYGSCSASRWYRGCSGGSCTNTGKIAYSSWTVTPGTRIDETTYKVGTSCSTNTPGEVCDGADNDCDGQVDEGVKNTYYRDQDGDGYGNPSVTTEACSAPGGYVSNNDDCDDADDDVHPGATEICNGIDDDCNGLADNADGLSCACIIGQTQPCGSDVGECQKGTETCLQTPGGSEWDCQGGVWPVAETCDNKDNDCDGVIDNGLVQSCGSGVCSGTSTCSAGSWGDCSTKNNDCGVCAKCDASGTCTYDETQDSDCDSYDLVEIATCTNNPDSKSYTWDAAAGFDSVCTSIYTCTQSSYSYTHTCNKATCSAECDDDGDCPNYCDGITRYYGAVCDIIGGGGSDDCGCDYLSESCPVSELDDGSDICYYRTAGDYCDASGCQTRSQENCPDYCINDNDGGSCSITNHQNNYLDTAQTCYYTDTCSDSGCLLTSSGSLRADYCDVCSASGVSQGDSCPNPSSSCSSGCPDSGTRYYESTPTDRTDDCSGTTCNVDSCQLAFGYVFNSATGCYCDNTECAADCQAVGGEYYTSGTCVTGTCNCAPSDFTIADNPDAVKSGMSVTFTATSKGSKLDKENELLSMNICADGGCSSNLHSWGACTGLDGSQKSVVCARTEPTCNYDVSNYWLKLTDPNAQAHTVGVGTHTGKKDYLCSGCVGNGGDVSCYGSSGSDGECDISEDKCISCNGALETQNGKCEEDCGSVYQCDELSTGTVLNTCGDTGYSYYADKCSATCGLEDEPICRDSTYAAGCTATSFCNTHPTGYYSLPTDECCYNGCDTLDCDSYDDTNPDFASVTESEVSGACIESCTGQGCCDVQTAVCQLSNNCKLVSEVISNRDEVIDYRCYNNAGPWEWRTSAPPELTCDDGLDNDCDGAIDVDDWQECDWDQDGVINPIDNCPIDYNPDQWNTDGAADGGDACDDCPAVYPNDCDPQYTTGTSIDETGGTLTNTAGEVLIEVPPGAFIGDTSVSMSKGQTNYKVEYAGRRSATVIYDYDLTAGQDPFNIPVSLTFYWGEDLTDIEEQNVHVYYYDDVTSTWEKILPEYKDYQANTIMVYTNHFTIFALLVPDPNGLKGDALEILGGLTSSKKNVMKEISKASEHIEKSLGNLSAYGDKHIIWINGTTIERKHGKKVFDNEKKAVEKLKKIINPGQKNYDHSISEDVSEVIELLVDADRVLAEEAIGAAIFLKDIEKAEKEMLKAEQETEPDKKIEHYKKAWEHASKHIVRFRDFAGSLGDAAIILGSLNANDKKEQKKIEGALYSVLKALGNLSEQGDKHIKWINVTTIERKHGYKVFDYLRGAIKKLEKVDDLAVQNEVDGTITLLVSITHAIAEEAIGASTDEKDIEKAEKEMLKADQETKLDKKIEHYKKAWRRVSKKIKGHVTGGVVAVGGEQAVSTIMVLVIAALGLLIFARLKK